LCLGQVPEGRDDLQLVAEPHRQRVPDRFEEFDLRVRKGISRQRAERKRASRPMPSKAQRTAALLISTTFLPGIWTAPASVSPAGIPFPLMLQCPG
jgi:hypothetical protein